MLNFCVDDYNNFEIYSSLKVKLRCATSFSVHFKISSEATWLVGYVTVWKLYLDSIQFTRIIAFSYREDFV